MANKKILAEKHIDRIKNKFVNKASVSEEFVPPVSSENYQRFLQYKDTFRQTAGYKMKDLYPDTYQTMTSIPTDIDYSKLVRADGLFEGCAALQSVDGLDLSSAISASHLFEGCTSLTSVKGLNTPNVADFSFAFYDCENLSELEEFNTSKCHDFCGMFAGCASLPEKFPWTLNMMALQKHREKLMFHCSSVKEMDCYVSFLTSMSFKRDSSIIADENGTKVYASKNLLKYIMLHPEAIGSEVHVSNGLIDDSLSVDAIVNGTGYYASSLSNCQLILDSDVFNNILNFQSWLKAEQHLAFKISLKPEAITEEYEIAGSLPILRTITSGKVYFKKADFKIIKVDFNLNILGE